MRIGVVAPASRGNRDALAPASAFAAIAYPEVELVFSEQCWATDGHFAGDDAARAAAFVGMANDPAIDAIWFLRGGYGANRLLATVMPELGPAARGKAYCGYSDAGFLLGALYARRIGRPVHGPMVSDIRRQGGDATVARSLGWLARGDRQGLEPGLVSGRPAAAFNLSILGALVGTPWLPDLTDHVLLIEEVSEPLYNVDRLLWHMAHATQLKGGGGRPARRGQRRDAQRAGVGRELGDDDRALVRRDGGAVPGTGADRAYRRQSRRAVRGGVTDRAVGPASEL